MKKYIFKTNNGAVTLLAVIIVGFIVTTLIIVSSLYSRLSILNSKMVVDLEKSEYFSESCIEKALRTIRDNRTYVGSGTLVDGILNCSYIVSDNGTNSRLIKASSTYNGVNYFSETDISIGSTQISIDYWKRKVSL
ncbi:MAG: hypothetical protein RLZZ546_1427 [Bacteroidota bacterium]